MGDRKENKAQTSVDNQGSGSRGTHDERQCEPSESRDQGFKLVGFDQRTVKTYFFLIAWVAGSWFLNKFTDAFDVAFPKAMAQYIVKMENIDRRLNSCEEVNKEQDQHIFKLWQEVWKGQVRNVQ